MKLFKKLEPYQEAAKISYKAEKERIALDFKRGKITKEEKAVKLLKAKEKFLVAFNNNPENKLLLATSEERPVYDEGYDKKENTIIRLVSNKKNDKVYKTTGIADTVSKNNWKAWIYLGPVIVLLTVFLLYPLINTIFISFTADYKYATGEFAGLTLRNFPYILGLVDNGRNGAMEVYFTQYALVNTLFLTFITVPVSIALALIISVALNSIKWFQKVLQTVFFLPYVTNTIAVGMVFSVIFDDSGIINFIFNSSTVWIKGADRWTAMIPLCIYIVWNSMPFKILIFLSGLQNIDKQYYQAAQIDSAPKWKTFFKVTVPLLSPQILYIMVTSFIGAFKEYSTIVGLFNGPGTLSNNGVSTNPNMETIVYYVYDNISTHTQYAAAAAVLLFVIIMAFTFLQLYVSKKRVHY